MTSFRGTTGDDSDLKLVVIASGIFPTEIERVNQQFARVEQIKKFRLLKNKLGAEDEELTPAMKLKRKLVSQKYAELIELM